MSQEMPRSKICGIEKPHIYKHRNSWTFIWRPEWLRELKIGRKSIWMTALSRERVWIYGVAEIYKILYRVNLTGYEHLNQSQLINALSKNGLKFMTTMSIESKPLSEETVKRLKELNTKL